MNLAEELALLAHDDEGKPITDGLHLDNGLGGALLLELTLGGKIGLDGKDVVVRDATPTGDPLVDAALARVAAEARPRKPKHWVQKFAKNARTETMQRLVERQVVGEEKHKALGLFPRRRYPAAQGVEPPAETEARDRMRSALAGSGPPDARTAALCALVAATDLDKKVFGDLDRKQVKARLKQIGEGDWAAAAVKKTISDVQAAVMAAVIASTSASAASAGSS